MHLILEPLCLDIKFNTCKIKYSAHNQDRYTTYSSWKKNLKKTNQFVKSQKGFRKKEINRNKFIFKNKTDDCFKKRVIWIS